MISLEDDVGAYQTLAMGSVVGGFDNRSRYCIDHESDRNDDGSEEPVGEHDTGV